MSITRYACIDLLESLAEFQWHRYKSVRAVNDVDRFEATGLIRYKPLKFGRKTSYPAGHIDRQWTKFVEFIETDSKYRAEVPNGQRLEMFVEHLLEFGPLGSGGTDYRDPGSFNKFLETGEIFARAVRVLTGGSCVYGGSEVEQGRNALNGFLSRLKPSLELGGSSSSVVLRPSTLIEFYALNACADIGSGIVSICAGCRKLFCSNYGRARFCGSRCRNSVTQREYRARKAA